MALDDARAEVVHLRDERALTYTQWGTPGGRPIFHFHGVPGGRLTRWGDDSLYGARKVRLITVDRPGIGRSDAKPGRSVADWASDVEELADQLGLDRFGVLGFSAGAPYALACARLLHPRVDAVALVSGVGRLDQSGVVDQMATARFWRLARRAPWAMGLIYSTIGRGARKNPDAAHERFFRGASKVDRAVLDRPEVRSRWWPAFLEATRPGGRGLADDMRTVLRSWGFDPSEIRVPVHLWHGRRDRIAPPAHAEHWIEVLHDPRLDWLDEEGHFLIEDHTEEVLDALAP